MLRISKLADYGSIIMVYLAQNSHRLCSAREISDSTHVGLATVSKLLKRLLSAGLLLSVRGVSGGYKLKRSSADISVMDILYAVEKPRGLTACSEQPNACALTGICHMQNHWKIISKTINQAIAGISLATLISRSI